ncbi:MAG: hypothetical protein DRP85_02425 [Candidatus Makaraimicrobium thalassicum]|nr:MAG: hypothetical protein DRP85_02425 [Candidatus Omnitrophota bacterium]
MILDEQDPLILALLIEELTGLQKEYMEDAGEDAELKRNRRMEAIEELADLLQSHGDNDVLRKNIMPHMDNLLREYVSSEKKALKALSGKMHELRDTGGWHAVLGLKIFSGYLDAMFDRQRNRQETPAGFNFDYILRELPKGLQSTKGPAREAAIEEIMSILEKDITRGAGAEKEYLIDQLLKEISEDKSYRDLFMRIAGTRLVDSRWTAGMDKWAQIYLREKLGEIRGIKDDDERRNGIRDLTEWLNRITNKTVLNRAMAQIKDIGFKAEVLGLAANLDNVPIYKRIEFFVFAVKNSADMKTRDNAISNLDNLIKNEKTVLRVNSADTLLRLSDEILGKKDLTDREAVRIYNLLVSLEARKVKGRLANVTRKRQETLEEIKRSREDALKETKKAKFKSMLEKVDAKIELAGVYEQDGELEKAQKQLEEANTILNDEMKTVIRLQREEKSDEYGGTPEDVNGVIGKNHDIVNTLERVLKKQDKINADWYISRARGEILLARFYMARGDLALAEKHLKGEGEHAGAFGHLEEAQRRDPAAGNLRTAFNLARLEMSRLRLMEKLDGEDYVFLLASREELHSDKDKLDKELKEINDKIEKLDKEIDELERKTEPCVRFLENLEFARSKNDRVLALKYEKDLKAYEKDFGISEKEKELEAAKKEQVRLKAKAEEITEKLDALKEKIDGLAVNFTEGGPAVPEMKGLIFSAIDVTSGGDKEDEDVKKIRGFLISITDGNVRSMLLASINRVREEIREIQDKLGRTERQEQDESLTKLEFDIVYKILGKEEADQSIKRAQNNQIPVAGTVLNAAEFLEYLTKKLEDEKGGLIEILREITLEADDNMLKIIAKERLLDVIFELAGLKDDPELFKNKHTEEIKDILYKRLNEKLTEADKEYEATDTLLDTLAPFIGQTAQALEQDNKKWHDMNTFKRRLMLAQGDEDATLRISALEADKYNAEGFTELGRKELERGNLFDALDHFETALVISDDLPEANLYKARALAGLGRLHDAAESFKKALEKDPENEKAMEDLKEIYTRLYDDMNRADTDLKLYELYMKKGREDEDNNRLREAKANYEKAESCARDAALARPRFAGAKRAQVSALIKLKRHKEAKKIINGVIADSMQFMLQRSIWSERTSLKRLWSRRKAKKGLELYGPVVIQEDAAGFITDLAGIYIDRGDENPAKMAKKVIDEYKDILKKSSLANALLAQAHETLGNGIRAWFYLGKAARIREKDTDTRERMIGQYEDRGGFGNISKAIELAEEAARSDTGRKKFWDEKIARLYVERSRLAKNILREDMRNLREIGLHRARKQIDDLKKALEPAEGLEEEKKRDIIQTVNGRAKEIDKKLLSMLKTIVFGEKARARKRGDMTALRFELLKMNVENVEISEDKNVAGINVLIGKLKDLKDDKYASQDIQEELRLVLSRVYRIKADWMDTPDEKLEYYKKAVMLDDQNYKAHYGMAQIYYEKAEDGFGVWGLAERHLEQANKDKDMEESRREDITGKLITAYKRLGKINTPEAETLARELSMMARNRRQAKASQSKAAKDLNSIFDLAEKAQKTGALADALSGRTERLKEAADTIPAGDKDTELLRAKEFLGADEKEAEYLETDFENLLKAILDKIARHPLPEQKNLIDRLVEKVSVRPVDKKAASRLEKLLRLTREKNLPGRDNILLRLIRFYMREKETGTARNKLKELLAIEGLYHNTRITAALFSHSINKKDKRYADAADDLLEALEIYGTEAWAMHRDDRTKADLAEKTGVFLRALERNEIKIDETGIDADSLLAGVTAALPLLGNFDSASAVFALASLHAEDRVEDIAGLLKNDDIPKEDRTRIIEGLLGRLKTDASIIGPRISEKISPVIEQFVKKHPSAPGWAVLACLHRIEGKWIRAFIAARRALKGGEKVEKKDSSYYYKRGLENLEKGRHKKAAKNLEKAVSMNNAVAEKEEFKESLFEARLGTAEKEKYKGNREEKLKSKIEALNKAMGSAYDDTAKDTVRKKTLEALEALLEFYGTEKARKTYKTRRELNRAKITALLNMFRLYLELRQFDNAEDCCDSVLNLEYDNSEALAGLKEVELTREIMTAAGGRPITEENRDEIYSKAYAAMAKKAADTAEKKKYLDNAVRLGSEDASVYLELAGILRNEGDFEGIKDVVDKALDTAEDSGSAAVKKDFESKNFPNILKELDRIDALIDGVLDHNIAVLAAKGIKSEERNALRQRLSSQTQESVRLRTALKKFYRESIGEKEEITADETDNIRTAVEEILRATDPDLNAIAGLDHAVTRIVKRGEALLSENRLEDLQGLLYASSQSGILDERLQLLEIKYHIAGTRTVFLNKKPGWQKSVSEKETVIEAQIDIISDRGLETEALLNLAGYYALKARYLRGAQKDAADAKVKAIYEEVLKILPFSLDALKGLAAVKGAEEAAARSLRRILNNPELKDKDEKYRSELLSLMIGVWEKIGDKIQLTGETLKNLGAVSPAAAVQLIDLAFRQERYDLIPEILKKEYERVSEYIAVIDALNRNLASLRVNKLKFESLSSTNFLYNFIAGLDSLPGRQFKGSETEKSALRNRISITRAYLEIGQGHFDKAGDGLKSAEKADAYVRPDTGLARVRLKIARGSRFLFPGTWWFAVRGLSPENKRIAELDRAETFKQAAEKKKGKKGPEELTVKQKIEQLQKALAYNPNDLDTHGKLKDIFDSMGQFRQGLFEIMIIMEIMLEKGAYQRAIDYYNREFAQNKEKYREYPSELSELDKLKNEAETRRRAETARAAKRAEKEKKPVTAKIPGKGIKEISEEAKKEEGIERTIVEDALVKDIWAGTVLTTRAPPQVILARHPSKDGKKFFRSDTGKEDIEAYSEYRYDGSARRHTLTIHVKEAHYQDELRTNSGSILSQVIAHEIAEQVLGLNHSDACGFEKKFASEQARQHNMSDRIKFCIDEAAERSDEAYLKELLEEYPRLGHPKDPEGRFYDYVLAKLSEIYRTRIPERPAKTAVIAIVAGEAMAEELNKQDEYSDILFLAVEEGEKGMKALETLRGPPVRFLVDMTPETAAANMRGIITQARRQSFVNAHPYLAGLDCGSVTELKVADIKTGLRIIRDSLPEETRLDNMVDALINAYIPAASAGISPPAGIVTRADEEMLVRGSAQALKDLRDARDRGRALEEPEKYEANLDSLRAALADIMRGSGPEKVDKILSRHEWIAMAQAMEDEVSGLIKTFRGRDLIPGKEAIVIDSREESGFRLEYMIPALLNLAKRDPDLHICVIDPNDRLSAVMPAAEMPDNLSQLTRLEKDTPLTEQVRQHILEVRKKDITDIQLSSLSIATGEFTTDWIINHVRHTGAGSANFVIAGKDTMAPGEAEINRLIPVITAMNLLKRASSGIEAPSITTVGCPEKILKQIETGLANILHLLTRITKLNIAEEIRQHINAITKTAISL